MYMTHNSYYPMSFPLKENFLDETLKVLGKTSMLRGNIFDSLPFPTDQNGFHYFCGH